MCDINKGQPSDGTEGEGEGVGGGWRGLEGEDLEGSRRRVTFISISTWAGD